MRLLSMLLDELEVDIQDVHELLMELERPTYSATFTRRMRRASLW